MKIWIGSNWNGINHDQTWFLLDSFDIDKIQYTKYDI